MNSYIDQWKKDEAASFSGWNFSYLKGRSIDEEPSWSYKDLVKEYLLKSKSVLDMGTGGGEVFSSFAPFPDHAAAIEGYRPNYLIAKNRLEPLGVQVFHVQEVDPLPFKDGEFDLVLNRHSGINTQEISRILSKGGIFLTQQVDGLSLADLMQFFGKKPQWPDSTLENNLKKLQADGFTIIDSQKSENRLIFKDVGALVYFLKAVPWLVPDFTVEKYKEVLFELQKTIDEGKDLSFSDNRYLIIAKK